MAGGRLVFLWFIALGLIGCQAANQPASELPTAIVVTATPSTGAPVPTPSAAADVPSESLPLTPAPAATDPALILPTNEPLPTATPPIPDTGWQELQTGLSQRTINLTAADDGVAETVFIVRIDPQYFGFDVAYEPGGGKSLERWQQETGAVVVVNGGYFTPERQATGLIISSGEASGTSYGSFSGMLAIQEGGWPELRWLAQTPYVNGEALQAGLQSFPILVKPGKELGFPAEQEDGRRARRTVIGQDQSGQIYLIVTPRGNFTLHQLSRFLVESDLPLELAFNLDGGPSTGLLLANGTGGYQAFDRLPAVIVVFPR